MKKRLLIAVEILALLILVVFAPVVVNPNIMLSMPNFVWYMVYFIGGIIILIMLVILIKWGIMAVRKLCKMEKK